MKLKRNKTYQEEKRQFLFKDKKDFQVWLSQLTHYQSIKLTNSEEFEVNIGGEIDFLKNLKEKQTIRIRVGEIKMTYSNDTFLKVKTQINMVLYI